ncbi:MAG: hypothetical protein ACRCZZ_08220 [Phocaeicola sp.]
MVIMSLATGKEVKVENVWMYAESEWMNETNLSEKCLVINSGVENIDGKVRVDALIEEYKWFAESADDYILSRDIIVLNDGTEIFSSHTHDCCEVNYASFTALEGTTFFDEVRRADDLRFDFSGEYGFSINGYFIPCYSEQNGYYGRCVNIYVDNKCVKVGLEGQLLCD